MEKPFSILNHEFGLKIEILKFLSNCQFHSKYFLKEISSEKNSLLNRTESLQPQKKMIKIPSEKLAKINFI